jgi:hypothetical protein
MRLTPLLARLILGVLLLIVVSSVRTKQSIAPPVRDQSKLGDTELQLRTIARIRAGESYYSAVGDELRRNNYPTRPIINWRTPLHYSAVAALSIERAGPLLFGLGMVVVVTGALAYSTKSTGKAVGAALLLLGSMAPAMLVRPGAVGFPEHWAAMFIALSLNAYVARQWTLAAGLGITAVFIRELAAPYAVACGLLALRAKQRAEWRLWVAGGVAYAVYYGIHATAAIEAIRPGDLVREQSYFQWLGLPFVFMTLYTNGIVNLLPTSLTAVATTVGLAGAWADSAPSQLRVSLLLYVALFCLFGQSFNFYWGYLTSPIWAHAWLHAPEALQALVGSAVGQKAITSTPRNSGIA